MTRLISYKKEYFFLTPVNFDKFDMEFSIYSLGGERIGSTIFGIQKTANPFPSEAEADEFMEWLQVEAHKIEAELKFVREFNRTIEQADDLNLSTVEIMDIMESKWSIPVEVMDPPYPECVIKLPS
ncbi:hypothetical protein [Paenibacillus sp. FSL E2-0190]|uniref:hypothetical protein n=1 Tax=Paenibacillus sp. FSL E2-0190 TaxID=2954504 RepID=UPI0030ECC06E